MEGAIFLALVVIAVVFVLPIVAIAKASGARRNVEDLSERLRRLEADLESLKSGGPTMAKAAPAAAPAPQA